MALGLNLRSDLAKLSDAELADRFEQACQAYDHAKQGRGWRRPVVSYRGPIRHPRAYRFLMLLQGSSGWAALDLLIATVFSSKKYERRLDRTGEAGMHINLCEVKDIVEEIERRVESRKIKGAA